MIDLDTEMSEFFVRSIGANRATGVPPPFEIQRSEQQVVQPRRVVEEPAPVATVSNTLGSAPPIPAINYVDPINGRLAGGDTCNIIGSGFLDGAKVYFDNVLATNIVFINANHLTCTVPAYTHGTPTDDDVDVKVVNVASAANTFQAIKVNGYTYYIGPGVSSLSPNHGPGAGGTAVTVTGTNFIFGGGYGVRFGTITVGSIRVNNTTLTCTTPAHAAGAVNISVISPDHDHQVGALVAGYTFDAPGGSPGAGGPSIFNGNPSAQGELQHNGTYTFQVFATNGAALDTNYNGTIQPFISSFNNANASLPATINIVNGIGSYQVQFFLINLHAPGQISLNCAENLSPSPFFTGYLDQFFNP